MMGESDRIRWDQRYSQEQDPSLTPPLWVEDIDSRIPRNGSALDIAAGAGRVSIWLAGRGLKVTAVDISTVGLQAARRSAVTQGLSIETLVIDLETDPLPQGPFQVITCFRYWQPDLFPAVQARLDSGGVFVAEVATTQNLERHDHPSLRYLAEPGEIRKLCHPMKILYFREDWIDNQALARIVAQKESVSNPG